MMIIKLLFLLLSFNNELVTNGGAFFVSGSRGHDSCPCIENSDDEFSENEFLSFDKSLNLSTYGFGCAAHDRVTESCNLNPRRSESCGAEWCYVDPNDCTLTKSPSIALPSRTRYFSYASCDYVDSWTRDPDRMNGDVLQGVLHENYRGYEGTICPNGDGLMSCYGTIVDLVRFLTYETDLNITINYTTVPNRIVKQAESYQPFVENHENMRHGACVYAASLSVVDLCIGAFTKNRHRASISSYIEMGVTSEYLVVSQVEEQKSISDMMGAVYDPFTTSLWAVTFIVLIFLSFLLLAQEKSCSIIQRHPFESVSRAMYSAIMGLFTMAHVPIGDHPLTLGGRLTSTAIAVQILLVTASYTANLTNFLVRSGIKSSVESIGDAISRDLSVCVLRNKISILDETYGENTINYAINPDDGRIGFPSRTQLMPAIDAGICSCTIASLKEMAVYYGTGDHCDKKIVGKPIIELQWGIPVSDKFALPLNTAVSQIMQNGKWRSISDMRKPKNICTGPSDVAGNETTSLSPKHLLGAYFLSGTLAMFGIVASLVSYCKNNTEKQKKQEQKRKQKQEQRQDQIMSVQDFCTTMAKLTKEVSSLKEERPPRNYSQFS